jgi:hypothetical protein
VGPATAPVGGRQPSQPMAQEPTADPSELVAENFRSRWGLSENLLPLELPARPVKPSSTSARLRRRHKWKMQTWKIAVGMVKLINGLDAGTHGAHRPFDLSLSAEALKTRELASQALLREAALFAKERRSFSQGKTGAHQSSSLEALVKGCAVDEDGYARRHRSVPQVSMLAASMVEPNHNRVVPMLDALPSSESFYYSKEEHCIDFVGKSQTVLHEIEQQYSFVGGSYEQYTEYLNRSDLPARMWTFMPVSEVKAIGGIACVLKKDGVTQRKLLMSCTFNYMLRDVKLRSNLGMEGAGALSRFMVDGKAACFSACDQSQSFTSVLVPDWMHKYLACPPIPASAVWNKISADLRSRLQGHELICPCYMRLPMGCSDSVHILMNINLQSIGNTLTSNAFLALAVERTAKLEQQTPAAIDTLESQNALPAEVEEQEMFYGVDDETWWKRQGLRKDHDNTESGYSVEEWIATATRAKQCADRVMTVMFFFAGERRRDDLQSWVERMARFHNLKVLMISIDLATDWRWDLSIPRTFHDLLTLSEGYIDCSVFCPPCSTMSAARFNRKHAGPRPVRFRHCPWGRSDLSAAERFRVSEANLLYLHSLALGEAVASRGGAYLPL